MNEDDGTLSDDEIDAALDSPEAEKRRPKYGDGGNLELWDDEPPKPEQ